MKRIGLFAVVLLMAGAILAPCVCGISADAGNVSCTVNGTCGGNCTWLNNSACGQYGCNYQNCTCPNDATCAQNCSQGQNCSGNESCPVTAPAGCGTAGKGCPVNLAGKA